MSRMHLECISIAVGIFSLPLKCPECSWNVPTRMQECISIAAGICFDVFGNNNNNNNVLFTQGIQNFKALYTNQDYFKNNQ